MASFTLSSTFEDDFVTLLLPVDTSYTMDEVGAAAARDVIGQRVAARPGRVLRVRRLGSKEVLPRNLTVEGAGFRLMEPVEIVFE